MGQLSGVRLARLSAAQMNEQRNLALRLQQFSAERQALRSLALSRLPGSSLASTVRVNPALSGATGSHNPVRVTAPGHLEQRIITAHHNPAAVAAPRIVHPASHTPIVPHHQAPVIHSAPAHHAPARPHFNPPAHHAAPPAHHHAQPSHGGGGHGGGHGGHHR
jgi:hypothetical protein